MTAGCARSADHLDRRLAVEEHLVAVRAKEVGQQEGRDSNREEGRPA
jgi:hypothetical protein